MPEANIRGVIINYQVIGEAGPLIALTPGSRRASTELISLAEGLAQRGYRVLLHDRRNCGASAVAFDRPGPEHEIWAEDLHELCRQLGALPLCIGGASAGARLAVAFTLHYPQAVRAVLLWCPTGGEGARTTLAEQYYDAFIAAARSGGMQAVCETEHFRECIAARPSNRDALIRVLPEDFVARMAEWRASFLALPALPLIGATEAQLQSISAPTCIIAGNDQVHSPATARLVHRLMRGSELHDDVVEKHPDHDLLPELDREAWRAQYAHLAGIFAEFLARKLDAATLQAAAVPLI
jgi:pimeloyl-ACP methyl ester carboxylesterase